VFELLFDAYLGDRRTPGTGPLLPPVLSEWTVTIPLFGPPQLQVACNVPAPPSS
jgi:hypothetical protein